MKRYKFIHPPIPSNLLLQYFVTNMYNTNLQGRKTCPNPSVW